MHNFSISSTFLRDFFHFPNKTRLHQRKDWLNEFAEYSQFDVLPEFSSRENQESFFYGKLWEKYYDVIENTRKAQQHETHMRILFCLTNTMFTSS